LESDPDGIRREGASRLGDASSLESIVARLFARVEERGEIAIEEACAEDPSRADAIRALAAPLREAGLLTPRPPAAPSGAPVQHERRLGDFRLLREIGRGGMGVVYEAEQVSLGRRIALKVLPPHVTLSPVAIERFRRESALAARLRHPGIVEIHSVGEEDGTHFFSMEFIEGTSLDRVVAQLRRSPRRASSRGHVRSVAGLVKAVAEALDYAHRQGVVHRDVKPSNILLRGDGTPVLTDFGLARAPGLPAVTLTGDFTGTPHYVSPEQALATGRDDVDRRSDVFSLGVTLYEFLTLARPFKGRTVQDVLSSITGKSPRPPHLLNPEISRDLETIVLTAMEKDPARRYATAGEMADDLGRFLEHRPIAARPIGVATRTRQWVRRNPLVSALLGAVLLLLASIAAVASFSALRLKWQRDEAIGLRERAERAEADGKEKLRRALLAQASAVRLRDRAGRRAEALAAVAEAAAIRPGEDLRNEAIASLATVDLERRFRLDVPQEFGYEFSGDLEICASSDESGRVTLRRFSDGAAIASLEGSGTPAWVLRLDPSARLLAAKYHARSDFAGAWVTLFDVASGAAILEIPRGTAPVAFDFDPSGRLFATAFADGSLSVHDVRLRRETGRFKATARPHSLAFHPTGRSVAISSLERRAVEIRSTETGEILETLALRSVARGVAFDGSGRLLACAGADFTVSVFELATGGPPRVLEGHEAESVAVALDPRGEKLASVGWDDTLRLFDIATGKEIVVAPAIGSCVRFGPDGRRVAFCAATSEVEVKEIVGEDEYRPLRGHRGPGKSPWMVAISEDQSLVASCGDDAVRIFEAAHGREIATLPAPQTQAVLFHPGGKLLATYGLGGLRLWPIAPDPAATSEDAIVIGPPRAIEPIPGGDGHLAFTPDGRTLAIVNRERGLLFTIDGGGGSEPRLVGRRRGMGKVAISPDGRWAAAGLWGGSDGDDVSVVFDLAGNVAPRSFPARRSQVAFRPPDGSLLVASARDGYVVLETESLRRVREIPSERNLQLSPLSFTADGRILAVATGDASIHLLDAATFDRIAALEPPNGLVASYLAFGRDGSRLAVAGRDGSRASAVWDLRRIRGSLRAMGLDFEPPLSGASPRPAASPASATVRLGTF